MTDHATSIGIMRKIDQLVGCLGIYRAQQSMEGLIRSCLAGRKVNFKIQSDRCGHSRITCNPARAKVLVKQSLLMSSNSSTSSLNYPSQAQDIASTCCMRLPLTPQTNGLTQACMHRKRCALGWRDIIHIHHSQWNKCLPALICSGKAGMTCADPCRDQGWQTMMLTRM